MATSGAQVLVVGRGVIGLALAERGWGTHPAVALSSRELMAWRDTDLRALLRTMRIVVFAHGKTVKTRMFARRFDELLESRVAVLRKVADNLDGDSGPRRVYLVSSTVAYRNEALGAAAPRRTLSGLQRAFEDAFARSFADRERAVFRVGAVVGAGSQIERGLAALYRTRIFSRLRRTRDTNMPFIDLGELACAIRRAVDDGVTGTWAMCRPDGLAINRMLDAGCAKRPTISLPNALYNGLCELTGLRSEVFEVDMSLVTRRYTVEQP